MSGQAYAADIFQEHQGYQHASVLLFDPVKGSRQATKNIFFNLGFRDVQMVSDLEDFEEGLKSDFFDLAIADITDHPLEVAEMVGQLRRSELGSNPFMVVMLTSGPMNADGLRLALNSGADDLIMRPVTA